MDETKEQKQFREISSDIFKSGLLLTFSIGFWDGTKRQTQEDTVAQGANVDPNVYKRGLKILLPPETLKVFHAHRSRLTLFFADKSFYVPGLKGCRFVPKTVYPKVQEFLRQERESFFAAAEDFLAKYPQYRDEQISLFNDRYPQSAGALSSSYPSVEQVRSRFVYMWVPFAWDYAAIESIEKDAKASLEAMSKTIIHQSCVDMRQAIQDGILKVLESLNKNKKKVDIRLVNSLLEKIKTIKSINVFGDETLDNLLSRASEIINSVSSWEIDDINKTDFRVKVGKLTSALGNSIKDAIEDPISSISRFRILADPYSIDEANVPVEHDVSVNRRNIAI